MAEFVKVASLSELPPGSAKAVEVAGKAVALYNLDGEVYATDNTPAPGGASGGRGPGGPGHHLSLAWLPIRREDRHVSHQRGTEPRLPQGSARGGQHPGRGVGGGKSSGAPL